MARPLRILSVCRSLPTPDDPSCGTYVFNRIAAIARLAEVRAVQPVPYCPVVKPLPKWVAAGARHVGGLRITPTPMFYTPGVMKSLDGRWLARSIAAEAARMHLETGIDLIDAHFGYPEGVGCVQVARRLGVPVFITVRGLENEYARKAIVGPKLMAALKGARGCVCVSHSLRQLLLGNGVDDTAVRVVQNAVDDDVFRRFDKLEARRSLGLNAGHELVVSVGSLIERKRHHVLVRAFRAVLAERPDARLVVVGGGTLEPDYPPRLTALIAELGIGHAVMLAGNVAPDTVARWLQAADVFALATAREGCCNAVLEALAVGRPVVSTPVGDNTQFVQDGTNGYLVAVDDVDSLGRALAMALRRKDWNEEAITRALGVGRWERVAREELQFFEERLDRGAKDARGRG